jgi:hypothetical protein
MRERKREEMGRGYIWEAAGALPGRGVRGLAGKGVKFGQKGRGQGEERDCARESEREGHALGQEGMRGGARSARRRKAECMPARCSTKCRLSEHGRLRPRGRVQKRCRDREGSRRVRGGQWRGISGIGARFENGPCQRRSRVAARRREE